jgi:hypothetical protein
MYLIIASSGTFPLRSTHYLFCSFNIFKVSRMLRFSTTLQMTIIYQGLADIFSAQWMLHHLFGWGGGFFMGGLAIGVTVGALQLGQMAGKKIIDLTKSYLARRALNRQKNRNNNTPRISLEMVLHAGPDFKIRRIPAVSLPGFIYDTGQGVYIQVREFLLHITANLFSSENLHKIASKVPGAGRLYEYTYFTHPKGLDNLYVAIIEKNFSKVRSMLQVIPKESLNRILARNNKDGYTPLLYVVELISDAETDEDVLLLVTLLADLIKSLTPQDRILHLQNTLAIDRKEKTFLEHIAVNSSLGYRRFNKVWTAIRDSLADDEYYRLITKLNFKGESIVHLVATAHDGHYIKMILDGLDNEQIKSSLIGMCQHELNTLITMFMRNKLSEMRYFLELLPASEWQAIMDMKLEGSSMTLGEKLLISAMSFDLHRGKTQARSGAVTMLEDVYGVELPEIYAGLSKNELNESLKKLWEMYIEGGCHAKQCFVAAYGITPERMLGLEPLMLPKTYVNAYHQMARAYHPDRNASIGANDKTTEINAANAYLNKSGYSQYKNVRH